MPPKRQIQPQNQQAFNIYTRPLNPQEVQIIRGIPGEIPNNGLIEVLGDNGEVLGMYDDPDDWLFYDDDNGDLTAQQIRRINERVEQQARRRAIQQRQRRLNGINKVQLWHLIQTQQGIQQLYDIAGVNNDTYYPDWREVLREMFNIDNQTRNWYDVVIDAGGGEDGNEWQWNMEGDPRYEDHVLKREVEQMNQQRNWNKFKEDLQRMKQQRRQHLVQEVITEEQRSAGAKERVENRRRRNWKARQRRKKIETAGWQKKTGENKINYFDYFKSKNMKTRYL